MAPIELGAESLAQHRFDGIVPPLEPLARTNEVCPSKAYVSGRKSGRIDDIHAVHAGASAEFPVDTNPLDAIPAFLYTGFLQA